MEEFLAAMLEVLAEALLEILPEVLLSIAARRSEKVLTATFESTRFAVTVAILLLGALIGACSLAIFPHPLVHPSKLHGISLIVSPVLTGFVMSQIGLFFRSQGKRTVPLETFVYGFAFAFAMAMVRLLFVR